MTSARLRAAVLLLSAAGAAACAPSAVVVVSRDYDPASVKRVTLSSFSDFPGAPGSGDVAASTFEKYLLLAGYGLVDHGQTEAEGGPAGVDAYAAGSLTDYTDAREQTVMVDMPQEQIDPIYGQVTTVTHNGDTHTRTTRNVVTGYATTSTSRIVPETQIVPARAALSVRLVDAKTGALLWSVSASASGDGLPTAIEEASANAMQAVVKRLKKTAPAAR